MKEQEIASLEDAQLAAIKRFLDEKSITDSVFAAKYKNCKHSLKECMQYITAEIKASVKAGTQSVMVEDAIVYGLAVHYYDEDGEVKPTPITTQAPQSDDNDVEDEDELAGELVSVPQPAAKPKKSDVITAAVRLKRKKVCASELSIDDIMQ
jgi:hypothetical protein